MFVMFVSAKFLLTLCLIPATFCADFDPSKVNYCDSSMSCEKEKNAGCECKSNPAIRLITTNQSKFRQIVTDAHNGFRERVASGKEGNLTNVTAANMNALSYHLELEHLATCWLMGPSGLMGNNDHDKCRKTKAFDNNSGQNLAWRSNNDFVEDSKGMLHMSVQRWYDEVVEFAKTPEMIDKFVHTDKQVGHFTQVIWAKTTHVGCARGCKKEMSKDQKIAAYNCGFACIYAGKGVGNNQIDAPIFVRGDGCSKCENGAKCNTKTEYAHLCGEIEAISGAELKTPPEKKGKGGAGADDGSDGGANDPGGKTAANGTGDDPNYYNYVYYIYEYIDFANSAATTYQCNREKMPLALLYLVSLAWPFFLFN